MNKKRGNLSEYFNDLGKEVTKIIAGKLNELKDNQKDYLRKYEELLTSYLVDIFIPLIPDHIVAGRNRKALGHVKSVIRYEEYLKDYEKLKRNWPTFVFPHFRGSIVSGKRETAFLVSKRSINKKKFAKMTIIPRFLPFFHQVYVDFFGLGNTITEKVVKVIDTPSSEIFSFVNKKKKMAIVNIEINSSNNNISVNKTKNYIIVSIKIDNTICEMLLGKKGKLSNLFIEIILNYFNSISRIKIKDILKHAKILEDEMEQLEFPLSKRLYQERNYVKLHFYREDGKYTEFLLRLCQFFMYGEVRKKINIKQPTEEQEKEIDSILSALQALLIYCCIFGQKNRCIGLFYVPMQTNSSKKNIYPRCSAACFWESPVEEKILIQFGKIFNKGYENIQGIVEDQLIIVQAGEKNRTRRIGRKILGSSYPKLTDLFKKKSVEVLEPHYLLGMFIAMQLSEISKHEGDILEFVLIFGRKYHVQTVFPSIFELPDDYRKKFKVTISSDCRFLNGIHNVISRILGHYAIFSRTNVGLFAQFDYEGMKESLVFTDIVMLEQVAGIRPPIRQLATPLEFSAVDKLRNATRYQPEMLALIASGVGRVRAYHSGNEILEYHNKQWTYVEKGYRKFVDELGTRLEEKYESKWKEKNEILTDTIKLISEMPGKGACFIIGDYKKLGSASGRPIPSTELITYVEGQELLKLEKMKLLFQVAIMDGATIIDSKTFNVFGRRQLPIFDWRGEGMEEKWKKKGKFAWNNYYKVYRWGIRHLSALGITYKVSGTLAIVISADGPISVFEGGKGIDSLTYPPIQAELSKS